MASGFPGWSAWLSEMAEISELQSETTEQTIRYLINWYTLNSYEVIRIICIVILWLAAIINNV